MAKPKATRRVYHRLEGDPAVIAEIRKSGKLKGRAPRHIFQSPFPTVQAYEGPLPKGEQGFEFTTAVAPDSGGAPGKPCWRACTKWDGGSRVGIVVERIGDEDYAVIEIDLP